ncbi:MAG TPA: ATP-binding protein [Gemmata sp.]|nr:ATP-binding protein [Gemmata sp.]
MSQHKTDGWEMTHSREILQTAQGGNDSQLRRLLQVIPVAAYTCDEEGLITFFNERAAAAWGREPKLNDPADHFCGSFKMFSTDGSPMPHEECWMALALRHNKGFNEREVIIERPDGSRRTVLAHANPIYDEADRLIGAVNVIVDITERKQAEDAEREASRRKSEFLAILAHELRNPLAPIRNGLQILRLAEDDKAATAKARSMMEKQLGHMARLIDDLLDLSRIANGKIELRKQRIDIASAVQDALETSGPLIQASGHKLTVSIPPKPVYVDADRTRLAQIFANILNNGAKFTPHGGHIWLAVEQEGSDVVVKVRDNGVGIPTEMLPKIFDMFTQVDSSVDRSQGGLGIGLNLVRGLIEMHGGRIEAHSDGPGMGSEFIVRLSVQFSPDRGYAQDKDGSTRCSSAYRVLVVDDNEDSADSLSMLLDLMGHDTRTAYDGLAAVETANVFRPNVILLDIGLPKLNGYDACRRIREQQWDETVVIIALTGWGNDEDKCRSKEAGFNFHMVKPVDPAALEKLMAGLLMVPA